MGCGEPPQHKGSQTVAPYVGAAMGKTKVGAVPVAELKGFGCMNSDVTWVWDHAAAACT